MLSNAFKSIIKNFIGNFGYKVIRNKKDISINVSLKMLLSELLIEQSEIFFIQIGAYDGTSNDPIYKFVKKTGSRGVFIEPQVEAFQKLQAAYVDCEGLDFINAAVSDTDGYRTLYKVSKDIQKSKFYPQAKSVDLDQLASFCKDVILKEKHRIPDLETYITEEAVPVISPRSLLNKFDLQKVDVLIIDTEGYDFEIIKLFDAANINPKILFFEFVHLDAQRETCIKFLTERGYRITFLNSNCDALAFLEK